MDPTRETLTDKQATEYIKEILASYSPRVIKKCIGEAEFFYRSFRAVDGEEKKESVIRLADILVLSFLKLEFYEVFEFIRKRISMAFSTMNHLDTISLRKYFGLKEYLKAKKLKLVEWIQDELKNEGYSVDLLPHGELLEGLFALSMRCLYDVAYGVESSRVDAPSDDVSNSTSDVYVLWDYLRCVDSQNKAGITPNVKIYRKHLENEEVLNDLDANALIEYSRWLRTVRSVPVVLNLGLVKRIKEAVWGNPKTLERFRIFDTLRHTASLQFSFQLLEVFEKTLKEVNSPILMNAKGLLKEFWLSPEIDSASKLSVCDSFCNNQHTSEINYRLNIAYNQIVDDELRAAVKYIFDEINQRYLFGNEDIFQKEENFFYVIYQNWSGSSGNKQEIDAIHNAVRRNLSKHIEAIELFWKEFPFKQSWVNTNAEDIVNDIDFDSKAHWPNNLGRELFIPFEDLVSITTQDKIRDDDLRKKVNFWAVYVRNPIFKNKLKIRDDRTLRSILIQSGILKINYEKN